MTSPTSENAATVQLAKGSQPAFLRIPFEIRLRIYRHLLPGLKPFAPHKLAGKDLYASFSDQGPVRPEHPDPEKFEVTKETILSDHRFLDPLEEPRHLAIMAVNKQLYFETSKLVYAQKALALTVHHTTLTFCRGMIVEDTLCCNARTLSLLLRHIDKVVLLKRRPWGFEDQERVAHAEKLAATLLFEAWRGPHSAFRSLELFLVHEPRDTKGAIHGKPRIQILPKPRRPFNDPGNVKIVNISRTIPFFCSIEERCVLQRPGMRLNSCDALTELSTELSLYLRQRFSAPRRAEYMLMQISNKDQLLQTLIKVQRQTEYLRASRPRDMEGQEVEPLLVLWDHLCHWLDSTCLETARATCLWDGTCSRLATILRRMAWKATLRCDKSLLKKTIQGMMKMNRLRCENERRTEHALMDAMKCAFLRSDMSMTDTDNARADLFGQLNEIMESALSWLPTDDREYEGRWKSERERFLS